MRLRGMDRGHNRRRPPATDKRLAINVLAGMFDQDVEDARVTFRCIELEIQATWDPEPWIAAACELEARGRISRNAVAYLADMFMDYVYEEAMEHDPDLIRLDDAIDAIERAHGRAGDYGWRTEEGPPEWRALTAAWDARIDALQAERLRAMGFRELADVLADDLDEWNRRGRAGWVEVWRETAE